MGAGVEGPVAGAVVGAGVGGVPGIAHPERRIAPAKQAKGLFVFIVIVIVHLNIPAA